MPTGTCLGSPALQLSKPSPLSQLVLSYIRSCRVRRKPARLSSFLTYMWKGVNRVGLNLFAELKGYAGAYSDFGQF